MANWTRSGDCNHCGECCGSNGQYNTTETWEEHRFWEPSDVTEHLPLWTLFGLGYNPQEEMIQPESDTGFYRVKGVQYFYEWTLLPSGKGHVPVKPGTTECPFLQDDPGDGSRPCALVDSQDEGARTKYCRPEERPEPPQDYDIWTQESKDQWEADHPNCSYLFIEIV
jgi:Fe-S-cluster containining protein